MESNTPIPDIKIHAFGNNSSLYDYHVGNFLQTTQIENASISYVAVHKKRNRDFSYPENVVLINSETKTETRLRLPYPTDEIQLISTSISLAKGQYLHVLVESIYQVINRNI